MSPINILQANKELHTNQIPESDIWLSKPCLMCSQQKAFLSDCCSKCDDSSSNIFWNFKNHRQFLTQTNIIPAWTKFSWTIQLLWADTKEPMTELEISGYLWLCWLHEPNQGATYP